MEVLHDPPNSSSFVPLTEHQSRTPASFYSGPPVLYYSSERCKVVILERDLAAAPAFEFLRTQTIAPNGAAPTGSKEVGDQEIVEDKGIAIDGVNVWVTSDKLLLFSPIVSAGVAIPYPTISLHAIQRLQVPGATQDEYVHGLYMQLANTTNDPDSMEEDADEETVTLTIVPPSQPTPETPARDSAEEGSTAAQSPTSALYSAVSACSNLHPDPTEGSEDAEAEFGERLEGSSLYQDGLLAPGDNSGGLPPPMPGSGGWITAENVHEYFDEEGNWKGGENASLGTGAGTVRPREEDDEGGADDGDALDENSAEETKWRRTD
ncbi:hypothetical protein FQN57_007239 [Myotisia sp. PD_48]|nr:hypothetical protein FQN57_007239 [Myotisia sp. PD_48]